jgi:hypothetical protein
MDVTTDELPPHTPHCAPPRQNLKRSAANLNRRNIQVGSFIFHLVSNLSVQKLRRSIGMVSEDIA